MTIETPPFVLSQDVFLLMQRWAIDKNRKIPSSFYFKNQTQQIIDELTQIFPNVVLVESQTIVEHFNANITQNAAVVSLDRAYTPFIENTNNVLYLDQCRGLDVAGLTVSVQRPESDDVVWSKSILEKERITFVDDVIFGGDAMIQAINFIGHEKIDKIVVGVTTRAGKEKVENQSDIPVETAYLFDTLLDEVCERDFILGTPLCGRPVFMNETRSYFLGTRPYVLPYGNPVSWASVPQDKAETFSAACRQITGKMWLEVGRLNGMTICNNDLPRPLAELGYSAPVGVSLLCQ